MKKLGEILIDLRVLTPAEVERVLAALRRRGGRGKFGIVARDMGLLNDEHILAALAVQLQLIPNAKHLSLRSLLDRLSSPTPSGVLRRPQGSVPR